MATTDGQHYTEEQLKLEGDMLDIERDITLSGELRCDRRYKGCDLDGDVMPMRCTQPATVRISVTEWHPPHETYEARVCADCAARAQEPGDHQHAVTVLGAL